MSQHNQNDVHNYTYILTILSVTMKIKFPCKMSIQYASNMLTNQVPPNTNQKYIFNKEITVKNQHSSVNQKGYIDVVVNLTSEKGSRYVGGILRLQEEELIKCEGERMVVSLVKCLDNEAQCQLRVDQVVQGKLPNHSNQIHANKSKNIVGGINKKNSLHEDEFQIDRFPHQNKQLWTSSKIKRSETKSELNFPISIVKNSKVQWEGPRNRQTKNHSIILKKQQGNKVYQIDNTPRDIKEPAFSIAGNPLELEVYREGYNKLKEKYRKQSENARNQQNKRIALETAENAYKLEVMRLKIKCEELDKNLFEKNQKNKQIQNTIVNFQKKELDMNFLKQQIANKDHTIKILEETIRTMSNDNTQLKTMTYTRENEEFQQIQKLKEEIKENNAENQEREIELNREIKIKTEIISKKQYEIHCKLEELEREKHNVQDLEKRINNKSLEFQKLINNEKKIHEQKIKDCKNIVEDYKRQVEVLTNVMTEKDKQIEDKHAMINRITYEKKLLNQNNENFIIEVEQLKSVREKLTELSKEYKILSDEKSLLEKNYQKYSKTKEISFHQISTQFDQHKNTSKKTIKDLEEKNRCLSLKNIQNQSTNQANKTLIQKLKRNLEQNIKENNEQKNKNLQLKTQNKKLEDKILELTNMSNEFETKNKNIEWSFKLSTQKWLEEQQRLNKNKQILEEKILELTSSLNVLQNQSSKLKFAQILLEQKSKKQQGSLTQKYTSLQNQYSNLQSQYSSLQTQLNTSRQNISELNTKIQELVIESINNQEKIEKGKKDVKIFEEKINNAENIIKNKNNQISSNAEEKEKLKEQISQLQQKINQLKNQNFKEKDEKSKKVKIIQILQNEISKNKESLSQNVQNLSKASEVENDLRQQLKQIKQQRYQLQMKSNNIKKQSEKFKQSLIQNLTSTFNSIPAAPQSTVIPAQLAYSSVMVSNRKEDLFASGNIISPIKDNRNRQSSNLQQESPKSNQKTALLKANLLNHSDIFNFLMQLGKQSKNNMQKVIDHNKVLHRENQRLNHQIKSNINHSESTQFQFSQNINNLQEEIDALKKELQENKGSAEDQTYKLKNIIRDKDQVIEGVNQQLEELDFMFKNSKFQFENYKEENNKRQIQFKKNITELKEQLEYLLTQNRMLQNKLDKTQTTLFSTQEELVNKNQQSQKKQKNMADLNKAVKQYEEDLTEVKKQKKKCLEKIQQLEIYLSTENQENNKNKLLLEEEQKKVHELRQFNSNLMKQKQSLIKKDLEKDAEIALLENKINQLQNQIHILIEDKEKDKQLVEELKENNRKCQKIIKEEDMLKNEQKIKMNKLGQRHKEKEKQYSALSERYISLQERLKKQVQKGMKSQKLNEEQYQLLYDQKMQDQKDKNQQILDLENKRNQLSIMNVKMKEQILLFEENIFVLQSDLADLTTALNQKNRENNENNKILANLQKQLSQLEEDSRSKEQQLYQLSGNLYSYEVKIEQLEQEKHDKIQSLNQDWLNKYEIACEEYQHKYASLEKEKEYVEELEVEKQAENLKLKNQIKILEVGHQNLKKVYQEKVKYLEDDRLAIISSKNAESQKIIEENKKYFEKIKNKESQCRSLQIQAETKLALINKLTKELKEHEQKYKQKHEKYVSQLNELRNKDSQSKKFKESLNSNMWKSERELKKVIQGYSQKVLDNVGEKSVVKVMEVLKDLEASALLAAKLKFE